MMLGGTHLPALVSDTRVEADVVKETRVDE